MRPYLFLPFLLLMMHDVLSQEEQRSAEHRRLEILIGSWTVPGNEGTYLEVCDVIQGGHIQCKSWSRENNQSDSSFSYLSWLTAEKMYVYYGLYPSGNSRTLRGYWIDDRFEFEGERITAKETTRWKVTMKPVQQDLHFKEEASVNGADWKVKADFVYKRVTNGSQ